MKIKQTVPNSERRIPKGAVWADAKRHFQAYRESGDWLHDNVGFDHGLKLSADQKPIAVKLLTELMGIKVGYKKHQKEMDFEILIANLLSTKAKKPVSISLNRNDWKPSKYSEAGYFTIQLVNTLLKHGLIEMKKGYKMKDEARFSRIWPTEKLLRYFPELPDSVVYEPVELVELRDEKGKLIEYRETARTRHIRAILKKVNQINQSSDILYHKYNLSVHLVAIFKGRFTLYGRLHTRGHMHYQGLCEDERREITINGDPTIELDFSGLHPHLLYSAERIQFSGDPYCIVNKNPEVRPFLKQLLLCMLNSKDRVTAERAGNYWLYQHHTEREKLKALGITKSGTVIDAFMKAHKTIAHYFCNGKDNGLRVMNLDAQIALDVVSHFAGRGIPILAVHDSFIVQGQHKKELHKVMQDMYKKRTKGFSCPIK